MPPDGDPLDNLRNRELDDDNPYEDVDTSVLPEWWQRAITEFQEAGLRPYRPPRLADGTYKYRVVEDLEASYGVTIEFIGIGVRYGDDWMIRVDGEPVASVGHRRATAGYSVFDISEAELRTVIGEYAEDMSSPE